MPLDEKPQPCAHLDCQIQTHYYKIYSVPYEEGVMLGFNRRIKQKTGRVYLCPKHYEMPVGKYEVGSPRDEIPPI